MNTSHPVQLSVVIPNYNCKEFLPKCLESVFSQGCDNFEVIVIDDGSDDGSQEYLQNAAASNSRLHPILSNRLGVSAARNLAVSQAQGEWIAFLDADDFWYPKKLLPQLQFMQDNPGVVMSFTDYDHVRENDGSLICGCFEFWPNFSKVMGDKRKGFHYIPDPLATLLAENVVGTSTVMVRRDAFMKTGGFDAALSSASDWDLWLKLAALGEIACGMEKCVGYLIREGSISRNQAKRLAAMETIIARHSPGVVASRPEAIVLAKARLALGYQEYFSAEGKHWKALACGIKAVLRIPTRRNVVSVLACLRDALNAWRGNRSLSVK